MLKRWLKIKEISLKMAKLSLEIESKAIADVAGYLDMRM